MKRGIITSLAALALWGCVGLSQASAQFGTLGQSSGRGNPFSTQGMPFGQGGNFNTYGILRAPFDTSRPGDPFFGMPRLNPDGSLQGQFDAQGANALGGLQTGHSVTFFDYSNYYPALPYGTGMGTGSAGLGSQGQGQGGGMGNRFGTRFGNPTTVLSSPQR